MRNLTSPFFICFIMKLKTLPLSITLLLSSTSIAHALTVEELAAQFESYKKQQAVKFEQLSTENKQLKQKNNALKEKIETTQQQVANNTAAVEVVGESFDDVSKTAEWFNNTTIGGYGELHYQNRSIENGSHKEEIDFRRFVLFFSHEFTDNLRLFSEIELEHSIAGDGHAKAEDGK